MEEKTYRIYVTDSLHLSGQNKYLTHRWLDMVKRKQAEDNRSGEEIAADIISRHGLRLK